MLFLMHSCRAANEGHQMLKDLHDLLTNDFGGIVRDDEDMWPKDARDAVHELCQCHYENSAIDLVRVLRNMPSTDPRLDIILRSTQAPLADDWFWGALHNVVWSKDAEDKALSQANDGAYVWMHASYEGEEPPVINPLFYVAAKLYAGLDVDMEKLAFFMNPESGRFTWKHGVPLSRIVELLQKNGVDAAIPVEGNKLDSGSFRHFDSEDYQYALDHILEASRMADPEKWDWNRIGWMIESIERFDVAKGGVEFREMIQAMHHTQHHASARHRHKRAGHKHRRPKRHH